MCASEKAASIESVDARVIRRYWFVVGLNVFVWSNWARASMHSLIRGRGCGTVFVSPSFIGIPQRGLIPATPQEAMT